MQPEVRSEMKVLLQEARQICPLCACRCRNRAIQEAQTETYSTTETAIGEWIDGSTIYRKCFHTTNVGNTFTITHGISNYGTTVYSYISADRGIAGSSYVGGERPSGEYPLYITNINTTSINCKQSGFDDWDIYVVLEYTKIS